MRLHTEVYELARVQSGADRVRTDDPRLAKPMLSQLSYSPLVGAQWAQLDLNQ